MNRVRLIGVIYFLAALVIACCAQSNEHANGMDVVNQLFAELDKDGVNTQVQFLAEKSTFVIKVYKNENKEKAYRLIATDIHPEGIYSYGDEKELYLKLVSRCAGNVFINSTSSGRAMRSQTTNKIVLGPYSPSNKGQIDQLIVGFSKIVKTLTKNKEPDKSGRIPLPVTREFR